MRSSTEILGCFPYTSKPGKDKFVSRMLRVFPFYLEKVWSVPIALALGSGCQALSGTGMKGGVCESCWNEAWWPLATCNI